jgi:thiol-disulfide isomerase/thioredoxin
MRRLILWALLFVWLAGCSGGGAVKPDEEYTKPLNLADYKGKVVLLDFWATWCPPCRAMIPHEKALVRQLEGKPFVLLGVSGDDTLDDLKKFDAAEQLSWRNFWDEGGQLRRQWGIKAYPTMIVLDHEGNEVARIRGAGKANEAKLAAAIDEALEKVPTDK